MSNLKPRNTQTQVKHEILSRYLETWGSIIISGLINARRQRQWHFVYVDCFSYSGKYSGEKEDDYQNKDAKLIYGSPIIGINQLDKLVVHAKKMGVSIRVNTILIEKDKKTYEELKDTLKEAGYSQRVMDTRDFHGLGPGQIALINADSISVADELISYTNQLDTWALYFIDPYGPSGIPYNFVRKIISQEHHDVMINFIYEDLPRKGGLALKENIKPELKQQVDNWTKAFGNEEWIKIAQNASLTEEESGVLQDALEEYGKDFVPTGEELAELKEQRFVNAYRKVLMSTDPSLAIKLVNLQFGDKERTMFYLFLTTHDATGALALNRILYDAKLLEFELRYRLRIVKRIAPPPKQWMLIPIQAEEIKAPEQKKPSRPSNEEVGKHIIKLFAGKQATKKDVYKELANTLYFSEEVDKALRYLRRNEMAKFEGNLRHKTPISFSEKQ
jgi:three-Cys-motif partner protein